MLVDAADPLAGRIELCNTARGPIDVSGWYLSNSGANPTKFRIPDDTILPAHGYTVFEAAQFHSPVDGSGFALDPYSANRLLLLRTSGDNADSMQFADQADFGPTSSGESWGRWPSGEGDFYPMDTPTLSSDAGDNSGPRVGPVVISEVMYHPRYPGILVKQSDLEYIEIHNPTDATVDLRGWQIRGGVEFDFAETTQLAPYEALLVVRFDPVESELLSNFRSHYELQPWVDIVGGFSGSLSNRGDTVRLLRAGQPSPTDPDVVPMLLEDEVIFDDEAPWPATADGFGYSLIRIEVGQWGNDVTNWASAPPMPGTVEPRADRLAITELNYNPHAPTAPEWDVDSSFTSDDFEFIELLNVSGAALDVGGMRFAEGVDFVFPEATLVALTVGSISTSLSAK